MTASSSQQNSQKNSDQRILETGHKLYGVLQKMVGLHRQLHDLCRHEREALVNADTKALQEQTSAKSLLVESIRAREGERLRLSAELAVDLRRPISDMSLTYIIGELETRERALAESMRSTFNALKILVERTKALNDSNRSLIERSLEHVHEMKKNVLGEALPKTNTYGAQGQNLQQTGGARLFSKEV